MARSLLRWVLLLVAFGVLGPACASLLARIHAPDGGPAVTAFVSESPLLSTMGVALALALAAGAGLLGTRLFGPRTGLFAAGLVLVWPAWSAGTIMNILRRTQSGATLWTLAFEGLVLAAAAAVAAWFIAREPRDPAQPRSEPRGELVSLAPALAAALLAGVLVAAAVARSELPGQALAAAFFAGTAGAMAAALIRPRIPLGPVAAALLALAFVGPASGAILDADAAVRHLYEGTLTSTARLTPLHWIAGLLLGVPVGSSWAAGFARS